MNGSPSNPTGTAKPSREEIMSALFANLVIQNTNMALVFLGKVPHPETNQPEIDFEAAQLFIDQLEMLDAKTRGNLNPQEQQLLKQNLTALRMAFVETMKQQQSVPTPSQSPGTGQPASASPAAKTSPTEPAASDEAAESRKKFTKKY